jgi:hypothetical protein
MKWSKIMTAALSLLGLQSFALKEGKLELSEEQKTKLADSFGDKFASALETHLNTPGASNESEMSTADYDALKAHFLGEVKANLQQEHQAAIEKMNNTIAAQKAVIAALAAKPEDDVQGLNLEGAATIPTFKPNMTLAHNRAWTAAQNDMAIATDPTIEITDLKSEFGVYIGGQRKDIIKKLTQPTETQAFMTSVLTDDTEWHASQASISSVVQQFAAAWTPLGAATFTPLTIKQRRHKINVPITPHEVIDSWLGHLSDESLTPKDMPITRYIINELIVPKALEDRELLLVGKGVFDAITVKPTTGTAGQATGKSMDGLMTILRKEYEKGSSSAVNFVKLGVITSANVVDKMKAFKNAMPEVLQSKRMDALCSRSLYALYKDAYQTLFPNTKNSDAANDTIDFSLIKLNPVASLSGLYSFFVTPKDNLIRLRARNDGASRIYMQELDYDVKVFAEWRESVGFAISEAIVAYIDPIWVCDYYAKNDDADALLASMLTDAGCTAVSGAKLALYKSGLEAASGVADLTALQAIVTAANAIT